MLRKTSIPCTAFLFAAALILLVLLPGSLWAQSNPDSGAFKAEIDPPPPPRPNSLVSNPRQPDDQDEPDNNSTPLPGGDNTDQLDLDREPGGGDGGGKKDGPKDEPAKYVEDELPAPLPNESDQPAFSGIQGSLINGSGMSFSSSDAESSDDSIVVAKDDENIEPGEIMVSVDNLDAAKTIQNELAADGYRVKSRRVFPLLDMVVLKLRLPGGMTAADSVADLRHRLPDLAIDFNQRYQLMGQETGQADTKTYAGRMLGWEGNSSECKQEIRIGMIDTAVDISHPALNGANIVTHSVLVAGTQPAPADHGTAVAGILIAQGGGGFPLGQLPDSTLVAVNAFKYRDKDKVETNTELIVSALEKLLESGLDVINLSFGGPANRVLEKAIRATSSKNVILIAAAGNSAQHKRVYPAAYPEVVSVTAIDMNQNIMQHITQADYIDFSAPGVDIWSLSASGKVRYHSGTSYAVPYVTALAAVYRKFDNAVSNQAVYEKLKQNSKDLGDPGHDIVYGWGLVMWPSTC